MRLLYANNTMPCSSVALRTDQDGRLSTASSTPPPGSSHRHTFPQEQPLFFGKVHSNLVYRRPATRVNERCLTAHAAKQSRTDASIGTRGIQCSIVSIAMSPFGRACAKVVNKNHSRAVSRHYHPIVAALSTRGSLAPSYSSFL